MTTRDLLRFHIAEDPQVAPDGRRVAWVRRWIEPAEDRYRSAVVLTEVEGGSTVQLTPGLGLDFAPRWSPDGETIAYLTVPPPPGDGGPSSVDAVLAPGVSVIGRGPELWGVAVDGCSPRRLARVPGGVHAPAWSPDGRWLAFTTYVSHEGTPALDDGVASSGAGAATEDPVVRFNRDVLVTTRLRWKADGVGYIGDYYRHVALLPFAGLDPPASPTPILLTWGPYDLDTPTWSPDGRTLAVVGNVRPGGEAGRRLFVYLLDVQADRPVTPRELAGLEEMRSTALAWSPDGTAITVTGHDSPGIGHYGNQRVWLFGVPGGGKRCLTAWLDRTIGDHSRNADLRDVQGVGDGPRWLPDGRGLLMLVNERGTVHLHRLALSGETVALTRGDCVVSAFSIDRAGRTAVVLVGDDLNPGDLFALDLTAPPPATLRRLSDVNASLLSEVELARPERFRVLTDGVEVDAWIVPPVRRVPGCRYPVVLYAGGGPGGMRASVFVHEFQVLASAGYAIVHCNARGNQGYGEAFSTAIRGRWGDLDYADTMACLRAALARFDYLDPNRLAVVGGSYGGYLAAWILGRHREFGAAVVDRSLVNRFSHHGTSDIGYLLDQVEFDGRTPWDDPSTYLARSPISQVANVHTPTLIVHSGQDHRCAVEQGEQLYMALRLRGVPAALVRFPTEGHNLSRSGRPWHRVFRLERYLDWFRQWL